MYEGCPKSVWAAIAVSYATQGGDELSNARAAVLREWRTLHEQGIVPQRPPKEAYEIPNELEETR